jgi:hypothetical protein
MYDPAHVHVTTADETGNSNGIVAKHGRILVHKVVIDGATSNAQASVLLHDALTITGTAKIGLRTLEVATGSVFGTYAEVNFNPPVPFEVGLSIDHTNTGTCRIYYTPH